MEQPSLFDLPPVPSLDELGPEATNEERAWAFRHADPAVYGEFVRRAQRLSGAGHDSYPHRAIWEAMRYDQAVQTADGNLPKLNNNHLPFFARWAMDEHRVPEGFFRLRFR